MFSDDKLQAAEKLLKVLREKYGKPIQINTAGIITMAEYLKTGEFANVDWLPMSEVSLATITKEENY